MPYRNAARGDVVDDDAMVEALKNGKVFAYGLDVYNGEPKIHPDYLKLKNIFLLPILECDEENKVGHGLPSNKKLRRFLFREKTQDQSKLIHAKSV